MIFTPALPLEWLIPILLLIAGATIYGFVKNRKQGSKQILKNIVRLLAVTLLCLAVFRPAIPTIAEIEKLGTNLDIYFVVDTTASMGAEDISDGSEYISRLDLVKRQIEEISEENLGAKYSLLTFDTTAKVEIPLVRDLSALKSTLDIVSPQLYIEGLSKGTDTKMIAPVLTEVLQKANERNPERVRVVYYFTDGEDTVPEAEQNSLQEASTLADERFVVGVGTEEGSNIPLYTFNETFTDVIQDGYYMDINGSEGISRMIPEQIEMIAEDFNSPAIFVSSTADSMPDIEAKTVEEKISLVDKNSPAQFEFYWVLVILGGLLLIIDMNSLYSQIYRLIKGRIYT